MANKNYKSNKKASSGKKNPAKTLVLYTSVLIILMVGLFFVNQANKEKQSMTPVAEQPSIVNQPVIGQDEAKVTLIEFGDYKCPSCKKWSETIYPQLKAEYIDTGKMKLAFINTIFHGAESELGAMAGEAVLAQNKEAFWDFNMKMFEAQPTVNHDGPWIIEDKIMEIAQTLTPKIDLDKLKQDLSNKITLPEVQTDMALVNKYKVNQTPTIMINGITIANPFDIKSIRSVVDKELEK
ncbi:DsbA family protein [Cohnella abietis]|uniref:Disulfide bond formation protein D n=1 Tax=Cohnella abietis TaxID=2507935 RepID=A0A3T1D7Q9_9BACL|nr:thioredoxin domain-containing protein [Cohnella abietis]BBI34089.1 disulfide bond formation protein D [Cohnella abietis]